VERVVDAPERIVAATTTQARLRAPTAMNRPDRPFRPFRPFVRNALAAASIAALAALLPGSPVTREAQAATGIQRCEAGDGTTIYTDKPCTLFGARATPMSGELMTRVVRSMRESTGAEAPTSLQGGYADAAAYLPDAPRPTTISRRSPASGCAATPTQLAMDLRGAFALGDVNRIAESYHWVGMGHKQAAQVMQRLEQLAAQPLVDTQYFDATISLGGYADAGAGIGSGAGGIMQLMFGNASAARVVDLDVERYAGCYFVRF
jgi:hypothetical protein